MFKLINFWLASIFPPKVYWNLAGLIRPWQAVLEDARNLEEVYLRGKDIVNILEKLRLIDKNSRVLDIGCGVGRAEFSLAKKVRECIGIDISRSMIDIAKTHVKGHNIKFYVTNGNNLKIFAINSFDLVFSILVFQHLPIQIFINYLKESFRVLKMGGKIFFQIPIYYKQKPKDPPISHPWALRFYSLSELENLLKKIKFRKIKFFSVSGGKLKGEETQALVIAVK